MTQLRHISLCNTIYKVISKIIVQRLRNLLPRLVSPNQVAFVLGRHIQDNIIVAQEVLHKFRIMKGKKGFIVWKIDLAKAYDKLQWQFIRNVITKAGLGNPMQVSFNKSRVFCSNNINERDAKSTVNICGSPLTNNLGKYLCVPLIHSRTSSQTYVEVIEKVQQRLTAWKSNFLSLAVRATLIRAVLFALPVYTMQSIKLSKEVIKHKYLNIRSFFDTELNKGVVCSSTWRAIAFGANLINKEDNPMWNWKFIWKLKIPPRIQHFHWVLLSGKTLTNLQRVVRGLDSNSMCPRCESVVEDTAHLLPDCEISMEIWDSVFRAAVVWLIWKRRCKTIFEPDFAVPQDPFQYIRRFCCDWITANSATTVTDSFLVSIAWSPHSVGWVKLNMDGGCKTNYGTISSGGVLRDHSKNWLKGFALNRGVGSALEAELWGLFEGLTMAWNAGFRRIIVETGSLSAVHLLSKDLPVNHPLLSIAADCSALMAVN
ncbi:hypothetical protein Dsin_019203 [Dipteronia sinensis]|uniref:Reverse transcriptase n=1 Tax=Dipteronia sinensis TaxID=43782 RepID=A0AAE0A6R4_9ROSI|nr:hypothetical protein Dsin_019203 [Dipteronia sinensis]